MKLKLTRNQIIALAIGSIFIIIGLVQVLTDIKIDRKIMDQVSFVLLMIAVFALFSGRKKKPGQEAKKEQESEKIVEAEVKDQDKTQE